MIEDAGQAWDPAGTGEAPDGSEHYADMPPELADPIDPDGWDAERAITLLRAGGSVLNGVVGAGSPTAFTFTDAELRALDVPLANMLNRVPMTRAAAVVADPLAVGMVLSGWLTRSITERRAAQEPDTDPDLEREAEAGSAFNLFGGSVGVA